MATLNVFTSTVANVVEDGFAPKGLTIIEQSEGGVLVEFTRPRTQKRDRRFIPNQQILLLNEGSKEADSGSIAVQELASQYADIEIESYEVEGDFIVAIDEEGTVLRAPAALSYITEFDVVEQAAPKKKAAAKDKPAKGGKDKPAKTGKGKGKGKGKAKDDWED